MLNRGKYYSSNNNFILLHNLPSSRKYLLSFGINCSDPNSVSWSSAIIRIILGLFGNSEGKILFLRSWACFLLRDFFFLWLISCFRCFRASFLRNKSGYDIESRFSQKKLLESKSEVFSSLPDAAAENVQTTAVVRKMPKINLATILIDRCCSVN